jgi:glutamate racemase
MQSKKTINRLGIFDSGLGGLSVLKELLALPIPEIIYVADTANLPYGQKTPAVIKELSITIIRSLHTYDVDAVVIASHTISATALETVQTLFPELLIIGVVEPVVQTAAQYTKTNRIGIIATQATIGSNIHKSKILAHYPHLEVFPMACPKLVPLIEQETLNRALLENVIHEYVAPLLSQGIDTLIIGCTHYELIKDIIQTIVGSSIQLISSPLGTRDLLQHAMAPAPPTVPEVTYYVTGNAEQFIHNTKKLLGWDIQCSSCLPLRRNTSSKTPLTNL